jgi:hypothetical protein
MLVDIIDLPDKETEFKIVQMYHNKKPILLCGSIKLGSKNFHGLILEQYLKAQNINYESFAPDEKFPNWLLPKLELKDTYNVVGMGKMGIDQSIEYVQLPYGSSHDYKIGVDVEFNKLIKETFKQKPGNWF